MVFPELGEPGEDEVTQLQDTAARFEVFYAKMQMMFHGIPSLTDHLWKIYDLVWFYAPLRIYQRGSHLIKTTQVAIRPYKVVDKLSLQVVCIRSSNVRGTPIRVHKSCLTT